MPTASVRAWARHAAENRPASAARGSAPSVPRTASPQKTPIPSASSRVSRIRFHRTRAAVRLRASRNHRESLPSPGHPGDRKVSPVRRPATQNEEKGMPYPNLSWPRGSPSSAAGAPAVRRCTGRHAPSVPGNGKPDTSPVARPGQAAQLYRGFPSCRHTAYTCGSSALPLRPPRS